MIQPANRVDAIQEYYFSRKLKEVAKLNARGMNIISLAIGSPDRPPSAQTVDKLCEISRLPSSHGYQPTAGLPELRMAMSGFYKRIYGVEVDWNTELQPVIGSKEGIMYVTLAFCNPGDEVLIPDPGYPTYTAINKIFGTKIINYNLREDNGWQPDFEALERMDLSKVKVMWTNYPNMPTGGNARMETYEKLVDFALRHNIVVVNDNPYSLILNEHPMSIMQMPGAKRCCIELNSMSKSHNMPGWRVAMMTSNSEFISWMFKIQSNIENGMFRGIQLAAAEALENNTEEWHRVNNIETYKRRRVVAEQIMSELGCSFDPRQVGMFLWGRIPESYDDAEELTELVLHEARVFITPGFIFGQNGKRYIRISLCAKDEQMKEALARIIEWKRS
jgi:LL-diaminopimelate aminotransferase